MRKEISVGKIKVGGGNRISVQSMLNVKATDFAAAEEQLKKLQEAKCDIVRIAVPDLLSAAAIKRLKNVTQMPIVADTHFNSNLTIASIENGADKVRINPGNMSLSDMENVAACAKAHNVPIRIGVNGGSVGKEFLRKFDGNIVKAVVGNLTEFVHTFENLGFSNLVLSAKCSDVRNTIQVNKLIFSTFPYPLHIGVTEAGLLEQGVIKNSIGIGALLADGIGDTIRVSLTADPVKEVEAGFEILRAVGLNEGVTFISCPKCGRCGSDLEKIASEIFENVKNIKKNLKIAVMGCEVNGPGECSDADLGLACGKGKVAFFKHGKVFRIVDEKEAVQEFTKEIDLLC